jgi:transposase
MFKISKKYFYKLKNSIKSKKLNKNKKIDRKSKITSQIKDYIKKYVRRKVNFDYKKLIMVIKEKFNVTIGKSTIYNILAAVKITKKRIQKKLILTDKKNEIYKSKHFNVLFLTYSKNYQ